MQKSGNTEATEVLDKRANPSDGHDQITNIEYVQVVPGSELIQMNKNVAYKVVDTNRAQEDEDYDFVTRY